MLNASLKFWINLIFWDKRGARKYRDIQANILVMNWIFEYIIHFVCDTLGFSPNFILYYFKKCKINYAFQKIIYIFSSKN